MATGPKGEKHLCGSCQKWHAPHRPDNCVQVPICPECWKAANVNTRIFALSLAKVSSGMGSLDNTVVEAVDAVVSALAAQKKSCGDFSEN